MLDSDAQDKMEDEEPTPFHVLKQHKSREERKFRMIRDTQRNTHNLPQDIKTIFVKHLTRNYGPIVVDVTRIATMKDAIPQTCPTYAKQLQRPITYDEILTALYGERHKAPGIH